MTKYQVGTVRTMRRSELKHARVNPRVISKHAAKELRANLKDVGLLGPAIVWNEQLGELLSGHQRLTQLDVLERKKDYELDVTVVRMDRTTHDGVLTYLNNHGVQGDYDYAQLADMFAGNPGIVDISGFDPVDLAAMFPDDERFGDLYAPADAPPEVERDEAELEKLRELRRAAKKKARAKGALDYHVVVVAQDGDALQRLLSLAGYGSEERYVSCERLISLIGEG